MRERKKGNACGYVTKAKIMYQQAQCSGELMLSIEVENKFRDWIMDILETEGGIDYTEALDAGAEEFGISQQTVGKWLRKMYNKRNGKIDRISDNGNSILMLRMSSSSSDPQQPQENIQPRQRDSRGRFLKGQSNE